MRYSAPKELLDLIDRAAREHGHKCPSLVYGCRLALVALAHVPEGVTPDTAVLRHTSGCLRDGALTVLSAAGLPEPASDKTPGGCSLEALWTGGGVRVSVRDEVRGQVDALKESRDLEAFRAAGVAYLLSLADEEFAGIVSFLE